MKRVGIIIVIIAVIFCSCGKKDMIHGTWKLVEFCYGDDCTRVTEMGINQYYEFNSNVGYTHIENGKTTLRYEGHQYQQDMMDNEMYWWFSADRDTLFTIDTNELYRDTFVVVRLDSDTLILKSKIKEKEVMQYIVKE